MKAKQEKGELKKLLSGDRTLQTLFQVFRKKDYNRIAHRLRNYQSLVLFLQSPTLSEMQDLQKINANMRDLDFNIKEIGLSVDEMTEDWEWLGLGLFAEVLGSLMEFLKIQYECLARETKDRLANNRLQHMKFQKRSTNVCEQCTEAHEATHIKRLKTSFGLLYPQSEWQKNQFNIPIQKDDLALREKQDFIDQLNFLLQKQPSIANLTVNTKKYKELVDCLSKMQKIDNQLQRKGKKTSKQEEYSQIFQDAQDNEEGLQSKYHQIIEEVKKILNSKFREGYSQRIRNMLDKFEIVLKTDQKKIQPKTLVPMRDEETQTLPTSQGAQLIILRQQIIKRDLEINGIKEGRKKIQEKYLKLLQSQRKISREASSFFAKNEKLERLVEEKQKQIEELQKLLGREKKEKKFDLFGISQEQQKSFVKPMNKTQSFGIDKMVPNESTVRFTQRQQKDITTQTEITSQSNFPQHKKKNHKIIKRFSILPNSNHLINTINLSTDFEAKGYHIFNVLDMCIQPFLKPPSNILESHSIEEILNKSQTELKKVGVQNKKGKRTQSKKKSENISKTIPNQGMKFNKSIELLRRQDADEIIIQRSQKTLEQSQSSIPRSSIFNMKGSREKRESREFKNINSIRLTQLPKYFRLNHLKTDTSKTKDESIYNSSTKERQSIIRINKYEKKNSNTLDRDRVREIVNLLKVQKENISRKKQTMRPIDISEILQAQEDKPRADSEMVQIQINLKEQQKEDANCEVKEDVTETIQSLKILIESQYTYLKASGFINFLLTFEKKPSLVNRSLIKYKFEFTHITEGELQLFGGLEQMVKFSLNQGVWERYTTDENDLKLYYKHINFAHKISKYFLLLKKMNYQFFQEYVSFITDPLNFSLSHFSKQAIDSINGLLPEAQRSREDREALASNELNWKKIMMRLIRFHHEVHKNCKHMVEFLDKIGYYRYSI